MEDNVALSIVGGNYYVSTTFLNALLNHIRIKGDFDIHEKGSDAKLY